MLHRRKEKSITQVSEHTKVKTIKPFLQLTQKLDSL